MNGSLLLPCTERCNACQKEFLSSTGWGGGEGRGGGVPDQCGDGSATTSNMHAQEVYLNLNVSLHRPTILSAQCIALQYG